MYTVADMHTFWNPMYAHTHTHTELQIHTHRLKSIAFTVELTVAYIITYTYVHTE